MCKYELAAKAHKNVYGVEIEVEEIKKQVEEIRKEHNNWIDESAAFVKWLETLELKDEFKKLREEERMNKNGNSIEVKASNNAMVVLEKTAEKVDSLDDVIEKMDSLDEDLMLLDEANEHLPLAYTYPDKKTGKEKIILSWAGIVKAMRMQGNIEVEPPTFQEVNGKIIATCKVRDLKRNIVMVGTAERVSPGRMGEEFKYTVLASKAIRNALKHIIEPKYLQMVIAEAKKRKSYVIITY